MADVPEMIEVDLPEVGKISVAKDVGEKIIKARDSLKDAHRKAGERVGALEAEKNTAAAALQKAADDKALADAVKAGEIDTIRKLSNSKLDKVSDKYRGKALEAALAGNELIVAGAAKDIAAALSTSCRYDLDSDALLVLGTDGKPRVDAEGKPLGVDALIAEFVAARPYLRKASGTSGSGAEGGGKTVTGPTMTMASYTALSAKEQGKFWQAKGIITPT